MRSKLLTILVTTIIALTTVVQTASAVGEAGVPSMIIPPGARANGMGEAFVAIADDATAAWWNVGGLAFVENNNLALMHSQLVPDLANDVYYEFLGYSHQLQDFGTFSFPKLRSIDRNLSEIYSIPTMVTLSLSRQIARIVSAAIFRSLN